MVAATAFVFLASLALATAGLFNHQAFKREQESACKRLAREILRKFDDPGLLEEMPFNRRFVDDFYRYSQHRTTKPVHLLRCCTDVLQLCLAMHLITSCTGRPTREAIQYMNNAGILEALTRRAYDYGLIVVRDLVQEWEEMAAQGEAPAEFLLALVRIAERTGFTNLDNEGVAKLRELMSEAGSSGNGHDTYRKRSNEDVRAELHALCIRLATEPELEAAGDILRMVTGVRYQHTDTMTDFLFAVLTSSSIGELKDVLMQSNYEVYTHALNYGRTLSGMKLQQEYNQLKAIVDDDRKADYEKEEAEEWLRILRLMKEVGVF
ncbi:hypothetical protein CAPTEDRAFT_188611 [Capitella teleta]|uniref:Uncharacterized protein n=1 Tax=Capitella teleta TaxID=283909 RepID=R7T576_CAPTE|nr:hypothetical protein CAPTEDRAFT_188611 [Capitella teleta]|eukprot:ELT88449.1 hypothetical protein CAPTEDRAFT_188611 [Capitella teleta]